MSTRAESKDPDGAGAARECGKEFLTVHSISQRELKQPPQLLLACWGSSTALLLLRDSNYAQDDSAELLPGQDALATAGRCRRYAFIKLRRPRLRHSDNWPGVSAWPDRRRAWSNGIPGPSRN